MHPVLLCLTLFGGDFELRSFGVLVAAGCLAAITYALHEARRLGEDPDAIRDLFFWTLIAGLVGARIAYVITTGRASLDQCLDASANGGVWFTFSACTRPLRIWEGGLVYWGGVGGGAAAAWYFGRVARLRFARTADILAPSLALGHAFGRIGCFLAGCCFGKTASTIGLRFPENSIAFQQLSARHLLASTAGYTAPLHATQLYEASGELLLFFLLYAISRRWLLPAGRLALIYLAAYASLRFAIEMFRGDVVRTFFLPLHTPSLNRALGLAAFEPSFISTPQAISLLVIAAVCYLARKQRIAAP